MGPGWPTLSTWISWPSPTARCSEVSGANGSARDRLASTSGAMAAFRRACPTGKIAIEEQVLAGSRVLLGLMEDIFVQRRERAGRVGVAGIARQRKGLAAAAAEIDLAEFARLARLRHPAGAAIAVEGFGILPDPGDGMIGTNRFEFETGDALCRVARQNLARWRDVEELPAPAAHALLRPQRVVIRHDIVDGQHALEPRLRLLDDAAGLLDLPHGRHQRGAVFQSPAVILHIGDFQPVGIEVERHLDDLGQLMQVLP